MASELRKGPTKRNTSLKKKSKATETLVVMGKSEQSTHLYRCPDGSDTTGGTTHDTKKHDTNTTRQDGKTKLGD
jgi:hypothetical protein